MRYGFSRWGSVLVLLVSGAATAAACGGGGAGGFGGTSTGTGSTGHGGSGNQGTGGSGNQGTGGDLLTTTGTGTGGTAQQGFDVQPSALQTVTVQLGQQTPVVTFTALLDGAPIGAGWGVDRGAVGTIPAGPSPTGVFTPTGTTGGLVTVSAGLNGKTLTRQVMVKLTGSQNGADPTKPAQQGQIPASPADLTAGGGVGGVGGEGLGPAVTDAGILSALDAPTSDGTSEGLRWLYPYDKTVWPRGLLAPLLMWDWAQGDADAVKIELSTASGSFSWKGTFARPAILAQTGGKLVRHPIPQDVWKSATDTAEGLGDPLTVKLTVARGGVAYGPISETWTVAPARLSGIIYYNSYGTELAKNYGGGLGGDHMFGGAVLSIHAGDSGPKLVAGGNSAVPGTTDHHQCRVCHSVAAGGSRLVVALGENYNAVASYDLSPAGATEIQPSMPTGWFPGLSPDGAIALTPDRRVLSLATGASATANGLSAPHLGMPAFSPDGGRVAFNRMLSSNNPEAKLVVASFDAATSTFSNEITVVDDTMRPGWPGFFPDGKAVIFERESAASKGDGVMDSLWTRYGSRGQIAWTSTADAQHMTVLNQLNGLDASGNPYLPHLASPPGVACAQSATDPLHQEDVSANYEPTVAPVAAGGYAWVVFTSRRLYGNVATIPPFCSDPREVDLIQNITPKKLWVAAIDINGQVGTDASHPAFYLPAQEILAGNSRGFWTLDPCRADGQGCEHGDECCNGYCQPSGPGGALVCSNTPPQGHCSAPQEKCTTAGDCCDPTNLCINGFCTQKGPS